GQVVGRNGIYDLNTGTLLQKVNFTNSKVIEFDKDGNLYFSKDNSFIQYKPTGIKITVSKPCMKVGESQGLTVTATYSDGTEIDVTASSKLTSSNQSVASVATGGKLNALSGGTSVITASFADLTATCNIDVGAYVNLISVSGYDIGFSTDKTEYSVVVPDSTTVPPSVTYTAEQGMNVKVTPASAVPGTTTVTVSDSEGLRTKTYHINFVSKSDDIADKMPYQIVVDGGKPANGTYNLNINIKDNPNYSGPAYAKFTLIVQRFNKYLELEQVDCYSSNQVSYPLSDDELVDIMVVDCFQKPNYVSVPLALPITFGLEQ
ncbi:MAG: Ig-like domain-containing protein, partial [Bacillota bacterium]|nr:Ig-like domain-containing protein [Bacillota bacterium]